MIASVIVDIISSEVDRVFDYFIPKDLNVLRGHRVKCPFGPRAVEGIVIDIKDDSSVAPEKLKPISCILDDEPAINAEMLELMYFMQGKYHSLLAECLRLFLPAELRGGRVSQKSETVITLSADADIPKIMASLPKNAVRQQQLLCFMVDNKTAYLKHLNSMFPPSAVKKFIASGELLTAQKQINRKPYAAVEAQAQRHTLNYAQRSAVKYINDNSPDTFLLFGVTGSGKTEVYLNCIESTLIAGKTAIMLVPEIALTPQIMSVFRSRFGQVVALMHSGLSAGERLDEWNRLRKGEARIAVGARSAVFAPLKNLGLIIIDEQHEQSYISESSPRFDTYDIAAFRARYNKCSLVLGSATPLVETFYRARSGEIKLIELSERINGRKMPDIDIVDMRREILSGNNSLFSSVLTDKLSAALESGNQAMLFINRRGYSPVIICSDCGHIARCTSCDVTLNYHKSEEMLKCHYCGNKYAMLRACPKCGGNKIRKNGAGTQRVCDELKQVFPKARVLRMDNDTTSRKESHFRIIQAFSQKEADILVGTQMIAKGHNFPSVTLVGVLDADLGLYFSDYRSIERTFSLVTQVAGRAGRADAEGEVVLQTHTPHHYVYKMISEYNYQGFYKREIALREAAKYPPFARIMRVMIISGEEKAAQDIAKAVYNHIKQVYESHRDSFIYLNAMKSPVYRIKEKFRYQILSRVASDENCDKITDIIYGIIDLRRVKNVTVYLEINPSSMF